ncbi:MAG: tripartite tricarboxylate transporter substrate binding protein [Betaproteobacteria bacterium]|jgi:tripartite-type tricarboxylate transporter receptor subunit TctC|nr:tripartite tricarboxylate transporter substrate binding protein [Betaproteobacteria bacterium]
MNRRGLRHTLIPALWAGLALAASVSAPQLHAAESYPNRPVRFIVTFPPGGGLDLMSRLVGKTLTETWGQQVIIDNRIGAGGTIGTALAARAAPNGYTLLFVSSSHAINPAVYRKLPFDTEKEFVPITLTTLAPHLLVVHPSFAATTLKELIAMAKAKPGAIAYVSGGVGSSTHLAGELLKSMAGIDLLHVPTKGTGPAVTEILSGRVPITIATVPSVLHHVKAGKLRALGLTSTRRSASAPEYLPIADQGVAGYEAASWHGALAPRGLPESLRRQLNRDINAALQQEANRERLLREGLEVVGSTPEAFASQIRNEIQRWKKVVETAGIPVE